MKNDAKRKEVYKSRTVCPAVRLTDELAETIALELRALNGSTGNLREIPARNIVEHARNPLSSMHQIIWGRDDESLAYEARCVLARQVVNSIRVVFVDDNEEHTKPVVVNVRIAPGEQRGYVPTDTVMQNEYMAGQIQKRAIARLKGWLEEFRAFRHGAIGPLWDAVNEAVQAMDPATEKDSASQRCASQRAARQRFAPHNTAPTIHPGEPG